MNLKEEFEQALNQVRSLDTRPSNENLLKLYGLYKQATAGDVRDDRPGGFDFKAAAKYNVWISLKGKDKAEAESEYVALVEDLATKYIS